MYSTYIIKINDLRKDDILKSLEFIEWKRQVKTNYTVFIKPNFTFPYHKGRDYDDIMGLFI